jgi:photosystem II stability/assembly factor-like uncharacterized protein
MRSATNKLAQSALLVATMVTWIVAGAVARAEDWKAVATELIAREKPGYGVLTGVVVHPKTGDVYAFLSEKGLYRSTDQGETWQAHGAPLKGRTEWPGSLILVPGTEATAARPATPDQFLVATVYDGPIVTSADAGKTWTRMQDQAKHVDWCATAPEVAHPKLVFALKHESGDVLLCSNDGGKAFHELGKDFGPACVFDDQTAVVTRGRNGKRTAVRTTDGGKTFEPCGAWGTKAMPVWHDGKVYWLTDGAIRTSADQGKTWTEVCQVKDGRFGPVFGANDKHMLVIAAAGIIETKDAGKSWSPPIALAKKLDPRTPLTWLAFDSKTDTLYVAQMGQDLYRLKRGK